MYVCCNGLVFEWLAMISVSLLFLFANSIFVRHATTTKNLTVSLRIADQLAVFFSAYLIVNTLHAKLLAQGQLCDC